jgi:phosphoribosylformimino-5-aminoimidazole carboxamide ribotide isomerase
MTEARPFAILPAIDLLAGRVVRLRQGDFNQETAYSDDPVAVARDFVAAGAQWLHVVDLDGARSGAPVHVGVIGAIVRAVGDRTSVEAAGGLRDEASVSAVLDLGAARAVLGTVALRDPALVGRLVAQHGSGKVAVAIDVREGFAVGQGWSRDEPGLEPGEAIRQLRGAGVTTFEVTAIDRDGLLGGPDLALYERLVSLGSGAIIASGGVSTLDDLRAVRAAGCRGAIVGRALYEGQMSLEAALGLTRVTSSRD